ncbi:MAG: ABC transporter ATP-binding protein [Firmicutes bacterium]|nr:ABC transporter ATP-binding protein [Bacillota bacterium]
MGEKLLLQVEDLHTYFYTLQGVIKAIDGVNLCVREGEILGLVGESGCGKSVTALSILGLVPSPPGRVEGGRILFEGEDLLAKTPAEMRSIRGSRIAMIFQEPMSSLNPVFRIGDQMIEVIKLHKKVSTGSARIQALEMLHEVRMPDPEAVLAKYPFQLSGGMLQRVMIAIALSCEPSLLLADEPTTALDVTVQAQILNLMKDLIRKRNAAVLLITHALGVVAQTCDAVSVMYAGTVVESGSVESIFRSPAHPYTRGLMECIPDPSRKSDKLKIIPGTVPDPVNPPPGCRFHPRCYKATATCSQIRPDPVRVGPGHVVCCHYPEEG